MATQTQQIITGTDFVAVATKDIEAATEFYGTRLGLPQTAGKDGIYAEFNTGNLTLSIISSERMGLEYHVNKNSIALQVENIEAARAAFEARGVEFRGDTLDTGVCHMAFFEDPDGNALMLHCRYAPRD